MRKSTGKEVWQEMKPLNDMTADDILEEDVFMELFDMQDQVKRTRTEIALKTSSRELCCAGF